MVLSDPIDRLMRAALLSDEEFVQALNHIMKQELRISVRELSSRSGIAQSSLYKILHGKRSPNISTLRAVVHALRLLERAGEGEFIGLIAARPVLDIVQERN
ncbi:MAG: helix-turn-helix domain-containing protein, partial [Methanoregulaceae archaeon]|nr:helix-turn-helix domain-containing protein [Methanoregulaceae archaeon]